MVVTRWLYIIGIYLDLTTHLVVAVERASMSTFVGCTCIIMHSGTRRPGGAGLDAGLGRASKARAGTIRTRSQSACREKARLLSYGRFVLQRDCREQKKARKITSRIKATRKVFENFDRLLISIFKRS